ncbi:MAG: hypothetical protein IIY21_04670 [Clostridiales bacterium]|nr:hypothetical protein [Clostridiales bacterium]MBQ1573819.1 hypothetical protein [Clostridiales bacterium]
MPKVKRGNVRDLYDRQYIYGVQISNVGGAKIGSSRYNFPTKTEAVRWAVKNTGPRQYASVFKVLNKYYRDASEYTKHYSYHVLAYEKGIGYGVIRQSPVGPILIDESEEYFYRINAEGRLVGKTPIDQIPLKPTRTFYNKVLHRNIYSFT